MRTIAIYFASMFAVVASAGVAVPLYADSSFKQYILDDCKRANLAWQAFSSAEKVALIPYLERVLRIPSSTIDLSPNVMPPLARTLAGPSADLPNFDFTHTLEPGRELDAKRCAVGMLSELGADAARSLPALAEFGDEPALPDELTALIDSAIFSISHACRMARPPVRESAAVHALFERSLSHPDSAASYALLELADMAAPIAFDYALANPAIDLNNAARLLAQIDPIGQGLAPAVEKAVHSSGRRELVLALSILSLSRMQIGPYIDAVGAALGIPDAHIRSLAFDVLERANNNPVELQDLRVQHTTAQHLLKIFQTAANDERSVIVELLTALMPENSATIIPLLLQIAEQRQTATLIDSIKLISCVDSPTAAIGDAVFQFLARAIYDSDPLVQAEALRALGRQYARTTQVMSLLAHFSKSTIPKLSEQTRPEALFALMETLSLLSPGERGIRFASVAIDALDTRPELAPQHHPAVLFLLAVGQNSLSQATSHMSQKSLLQRVRIAYILGRIRPVSAQLLSHLTSLLSDPSIEVHKAAAASLVLIGESAHKDLQRQIGKVSPKLRPVFAEALAMFGALDSRYVPDLLNRFDGSACEEKPALAQLLIQSKEMLQDVCARVVPALLPCIREAGRFSSDAVRVLCGCAPLAPDVQAALLSVLDDASAPAASRRAVLRDWSALGIDSALLSQSIVRLLSRRDYPHRTLLAKVSAEIPAPTPELISALRAVVDEERRARALRYEAFAALARMSPDSRLMSDFLRDIIQDHASSLEGTLLLSLISKLGSPAANALVGLIPDLPVDSKILALESLASVPAAYPLTKPILLSFLNDSEPRVQAAALYALLWLEPDEPKLDASLRRLLVTRFFDPIAQLPHSTAAASTIQRITNTMGSSLAEFQIDRFHALQRTFHQSANTGGDDYDGSL